MSPGSSDHIESSQHGLPVLSARGLTKTFDHSRTLGRKRSSETAVDSIDIDLYRGETYGLVGESGSGKSTTGRLLQGLIEPSGGTIFLEGRPMTMSKQDVARRRQEVQIVFQDPNSSLNPRRRVGKILEEALRITGERDNVKIRQRVIDSLEAVGFKEEHGDRFPHELSGGQRQRVGIARTLMVTPRVIICDEPVSALDVSIQAQILNLLRDIQRDRNLTLMFISHDMSVVKFMADRIGVMYKGRIVEEGVPNQIYTNSQHEYTRRLIESIPIEHPRQRAAAL